MMMMIKKLKISLKFFFIHSISFGVSKNTKYLLFDSFSPNVIVKTV